MNCTKPVHAILLLAVVPACLHVAVRVTAELYAERVVFHPLDDREHVARVRHVEVVYQPGSRHLLPYVFCSNSLTYIIVDVESSTSPTDSSH